MELSSLVHSYLDRSIGTVAFIEAFALLPLEALQIAPDAWALYLQVDTLNHELFRSAISVPELRFALDRLFPI